MDEIIVKIIERNNQGKTISRALWGQLRDKVRGGYDIPTNRINDIAFAVWKYKFPISCERAKYRAKHKYKCGYFLGDPTKVNQLQETIRPDLAEKAIDICRKYIESGFDFNFAPTIDRVAGNGSDYEWTNIDVLAKHEHDDKDNAKSQTLIYFDENGLSFSILTSKKKDYD